MSQEQRADEVLADARAAIKSADRMLTLAEVYRRFHVDRRTVYRWINAGLLKAYKLPGAGYRFERQDVDAFQQTYLDRSA